MNKLHTITRRAHSKWSWLTPPAQVPHNYQYRPITQYHHNAIAPTWTAWWRDSNRYQHRGLRTAYNAEAFA